jgi:hypothetical protein
MQLTIQILRKPKFTLVQGSSCLNVFIKIELQENKGSTDYVQLGQILYGHAKEDIRL